MSLPLFNQHSDAHLANPSSLRQQRKSHAEAAREQDGTSASRKIGLLSHTVIPSPTIQWILPARLRNKHHNDVVFVGERHLQLKEAVSGIHLEDVTSKSDFDAYIMAAKVINVGAELPWETQMKLGANNTTTTTGSNLDTQNDLPPQLLVLSLASRELVFLYFSTSQEAQFVHHHRPLPNDVSSFERFGRNIAIEPRSRAVAVSASCDYFGVFMLKKPSVIQSQMAQNQLDPILEERFFRVDGDIISMEFLYPRPEDGDKVILLLLVAQNQITHAICYEWDANESLRDASPRVTKRLLPSEDKLPTMLIPLTKTSSFMLVTTAWMAVYKNRDPRRLPSRYPLPIPDRESQKAPLWTRWARPLRNWLYNQKHDDIYLCREDGRIFYLEIGNDGEVENQTHLGHLNCDVDAAFDILDIGHEGGDLLLAAGNTGDGGLFVQKARDHPRCVQKFLNWSPVTDSVVVNSTNQDSLASETASDRLFVSSASTFGQGAVIELRHGIEAQIGLVIPLDELSSTRDIWTMSDQVEGGVYILTSDPMSSILFYLPTDFEEEISAIDEADSGLNFSAQTLAAGCTSAGVVIQVTEKAIHLGAVAGSLSSYRFGYNSKENVAVAAVHGIASLVVTVVRSHNEIYLHTTRAHSSDGQLQLTDVGSAVGIKHEPVCAAIETFGNSSFAFIGTGNGKILVYRIEEESVSFQFDFAVTIDQGDDISKAIEGLATINVGTDGSSTKSILFCGLRSGFLVPVELGFTGDTSVSPIEMRQTTPQQLGHTSVRVQGRGSFALLTCGEGFWQVSCVQGGEFPDYALQRIWITDQNNPAYYPKNIHGFTMSNVVDPHVDGLPDSLFCITDGQLLICSLDQVAKPVPRRINLPGSVRKLAYSKYLKSLIVAYNQTEFDTDTDPIKRYTRPFVEFVDPNSQEPVVNSHVNPGEGESQVWRPQGAAGEKITCILEWMPKSGDDEYHFIIIGTSRRNQDERGRVIFLQASRDESNPSQINCSVKHIHKFEGPVFAIAPYRGFTLMVSTGREIVPLEPKFSPTRWPRAARYSGSYPAVSMTAHEPYLYLSTSRESLMVLRVTGDNLDLHSYDRQKHDGLSHVHIGGDSNLTVSTTRGGRVSILTQQGVTENDKMMPAALCDAHLPLSVTKLSTGSKLSPLSPHSPVLYGTTMNGTIYRFLTLGEKEWQLLRLLQNLCERDPLICPFTPKRKRQRNPVGNEPSQFNPSRMHIDGDILDRLVTRGAGYLRQMLATNEFDSSSLPEAGSAQVTMERFLELTTNLLGQTPSPVEYVMKWLRNSLQPGF